MYLFCFLFSRKPLIPCVEKQLLGQHLSSILQKGKFILTVYLIDQEGILYMPLFHKQGNCVNSYNVNFLVCVQYVCVKLITVTGHFWRRYRRLKKKIVINLYFNGFPSNLSRNQICK